MRIGRVILPTGISLAIHAAIVGLAAIATWTVVRPPAREMPTAELSLDGPREEARESEPTPQPSDPGEAAPSVGSLAESIALPDRQQPRVAPQAIVPKVTTPASGSIRVQSGAGPASFAGVTSRRAASVVFVVDCSGSMVSAMSIVLEELGRSIDRLAPDQRFAIVPFKDAQSPSATFPSKLALVPATDANLRDARTFLRTLVPGGRSDPLAGLRPALSLKPEAIFFLARSIPRTQDTWGDGEAAIMAELDQLNPFSTRRDGTSARGTQINAIQFLQPDPSGIMLAIADAHGRGGSAYTVLTLEQLGRAELTAAPSARQIAADLERARTTLAALAADASDLAVLVGMPTEQQTERVRTGAMEAIELVDHASASLGVSEDGTSGADDPRVTLLGARAALLLAASDPRHEFRGALLERAARAATLLDGDALTDAPTRALALSTSALAEGLRDGIPNESERARLRRALEAESSLQEASVELALAPLFVERGPGARAVSVDWEAAPFLDSKGVTDPGAALLACDAINRAMRMPGAPERTDAPYASFLALPLEHPTIAEREAIVRARLERLRRQPPAPGEGEPLVRLDRMLSTLTAGDAAALADAPAIAARVTSMLALTPSLGAEMTLERAAVLVEAAEAGLGALRLAALLASAVESVASEADIGRRALEVRVVALVRLVEHAPATGTVDGLLEALGSPGAQSLAPSTHDAATLVAAAALVAPGIEPSWADTRVYDLLGGISEAGAARDAARALGAEVDARLASFAARDGDVDRHLVSMRRSLALSRMLGQEPRIEIVDSVARVLVELEVPEAVEACRQLLAHPRVGSTAEGRTGAEILLARALVISGDDAGALGILAPLARSMPEPGAQQPERFWQVWTLTLETMSRAEPARADEIKGHVTRLGLIDETLGGEPWASRLKAIAGP